jgi:hypothetical protein
MAQVQADTLSDDVKRIIQAEQFAEDFLLVAENDFGMYSDLRQEAEGATVSQLSDQVRSNYEHLTEQVCDLVAEHISPTARDLIAQLLQGQGSLPFDIIARRVIDSTLEERLYNHFSAVLEAGK